MTQLLENPPVETIENSSSVDNNYFIGRLEDTLEYIREKFTGDLQNHRISKLCNPGIKDHYCFVAKVLDRTDPQKPTLEYVEGLDSFREMLRNLEEPEKVETYCGHDAAEVIVLTARLPAEYVARVAFLKFKHLPSKYRKTGKVVVQELQPQRKNAVMETLYMCPTMKGPWTDLKNDDVSFEEMHRNYHCITMKINNGDGTIRSWNPGLDKDSIPCASIQDTFIRIGMPHFLWNNKPKAQGLVKIPLPGNK